MQRHSTKLTRQIWLLSKAQWEEAKAIGDPDRRQAVFQAERDKQIAQANERKAAAEARIDAVKKN